MKERLLIAAKFPAIDLQIDDVTKTIGDHLHTRYTVLLFYRGHW